MFVYELQKPIVTYLNQFTRYQGVNMFYKKIRAKESSYKTDE